MRRRNKKEKQKIVVVFAGGAMSGIFGIGVAEALQKINVYDRIEAVYGMSAGALNGAYFLSRQTKLAASVYYEDLIENFIFLKKIPFGFFQRLWNRFITPIPPEHIYNAIDIDRFFYIITKKPKKLDTKKLKEQPIPLYAKLLNVKTGEITYYEVTNYTEDLIFKILKAAVSIVPYYLNPIELKGKKYVDGGISEPIGLDYILKKHPDCKIILAINTRYQTSYYLGKFLEAIAADFSLPDVPLFSSIMRSLKTIGKDLVKATLSERVLLIKSPINNPVFPSTTDPKKLRTAYRMGKAQEGKIKKFINKDD